MKYTNQERVEAYLNRNLTDNEGEQIDDIIEYISEYVNAYTGRSWTDIDESEDDEEDEAEARLYDGTGSRELFVDDFIGLEKIEILDGTGSVWQSYTSVDDWQEFPSNSNPKSSIRLRSFRFPRGYGNIRITAMWGGGNAPKPIIVVTTALVAKYLLKTNSSGSQFKKESIEGYSYELVTSAEHDKEVEKLLDTLGTYRRIVL